MTNLVVNIQR